MKLFGINLFGTGKSTAASSGSDLSKTGERSPGLKEPVDTVSHADVDDLKEKQNFPNTLKPNTSSPNNSDIKVTTESDSNTNSKTAQDPHSFTGIPVSSGTPPSSTPINTPAGFPPLTPSSKIPSNISGSNGLSIYPPISGNKGSFPGVIGGVIGGIAAGAGIGAVGGAGSVLGAAVGSSGLLAGFNSGWNSALSKMESNTLTPEERLAKKEEEAKEQLTEMIDALGGNPADGEQKILQSETHVSIGGVVLKKQR